MIEDKKRGHTRTDLAAAGKVAMVTRALPGNRFVLNDGVVVDVAPGVTGITLGSRVIYVKGGPGANSGFAKIIGNG